MRLAIADPPYPPFTLGAGGNKARASRWYGDKQLSTTDRPADYHPEASEWDDPERHRALMADLIANYDGWAIATTWDGLYVYGEPPPASRILVWHRPNATPGSHRIASKWEPVILYPPEGRRSNRSAGVTLSDVLTAPTVPDGFMGSKPVEWARWVLDCLGYDPDTDTVDDLFGGSGAVQAEINQGVIL